MKAILSLPCKNKHSEMEKQEAGYHCKSCDHVLTDFRNSTQEEITAKIRANQGKICGIFNNNQFDFKVSQLEIPTFQAVGLSLLGILGFLGPVLTSCESDRDPAAIAHKQNAFNLLKFPMHVKGTVKDEKTGEPLPFFEVEVLQHNRRIKIVKTDKNGNFDVRIQKEDLDEEVFKLAVGGDTIKTNLLKFRNTKVRLTIKAEAVTEINTLEFITPKVEKCNTVEGVVKEEAWTTAGVPAYPEVVSEVYIYKEPEPKKIAVTYEAPIIYSEYNQRKSEKMRRKWEKKMRKEERKKRKNED